MDGEPKKVWESKALFRAQKLTKFRTRLKNFKRTEVFGTLKTFTIRQFTVLDLSVSNRVILKKVIKQKGASR